MNAGSHRAPGPKGLPILGNLLDMRGVDPLVFWRDAHATYGDTIKLKLGPMDAWFFASPEAIHQVLVGQHKTMRKGLAYAGLRMLLGEGLITTDKPHWQSQRQRLNPIFAPAAIDSCSNAIFDACEAGLQELEMGSEPGKPVDLGTAMTRLTMRVISRAAFGVDLGEGHDEVVDAFEFAFAFVADITAQPVRPPLFIPTATNRRYKRAYATIQTFTTNLIDQSVSMPHAATLSGSIFEALNGIDRSLLRDEVISLYFAGFETTARTMTFMMHQLALYPDVLDALRREADGIGASSRPDEIARNLPVATEIVNEALRLFPPVAMMARQTNSDCLIDGFEVRGNSLIIVCPFLAQRNGEFWPNAERFEPDPSNALARRLAHKGAFAPFGAGPRICLGKHFAMVEMALAIALIARDFEWSVVNSAPLELAFHGTLRPKEPIFAKLSRRGSK